MRRTLLLYLFMLLCLSAALTVSASANTGELIDVSDTAVGETPEPPSRPEPPTAPEPPPEAKYIITIAAPKGWHTKSATATVTLEDMNHTGYEKAEAKQGNNGAWQDISDDLRTDGQAGIEISDNDTLYIAVTDKTEKAHVKSLYIECFDRDAPVVKARIEGRSLRAEADDALSGVESIIVNGEEYDDLTNDTLDVRISEIADAGEEEIFVYAVDFAGNRGKTVSVKNPEYEPPEEDRPDNPDPTEPPPIIVQVETPTSSPIQPPAASAPTAPPAATAPPASEPESTEPTKPATEPDPGTVTPADGSGTVTENSVKTPVQREFFSITTEEGNDFFIVVDKQRDSDNVYLLNAVTEDDLMGLAKPGAAPLPEFPPPVPVPEPATEQETESETEAPTEPEAPPEPEKPANSGNLVLIIIVVLVAGGGAYYFKIVRPKQNAADPYEDEDDGEDGYDPGGDDEFMEDGYEQNGEESEE